MWKVSILGVCLVDIFQRSAWIRTRRTPNMDTFYALRVTYIFKVFLAKYIMVVWLSNLINYSKNKLWPLQLIFTGADVERRLAEQPFWKVKKIHNFIKIFCGEVLLSFFPTQFPKKTRLEVLTCRFFEQIFSQNASRFFFQEIIINSKRALVTYKSSGNKWKSKSIFDALCNIYTFFNLINFQYFWRLLFDFCKCNPWNLINSGNDNNILHFVF